MFPPGALMSSASCGHSDGPVPYAGMHARLGHVACCTATYGTRLLHQKAHHRLLGGQLQRLHHAHKLVHVAAHRGWVVQAQLQLLVGAHHKDSTAGQGQALVAGCGGVQHPVPDGTPVAQDVILLAEVGAGSAC